MRAHPLVWTYVQAFCMHGCTHVHMQVCPRWNAPRWIRLADEPFEPRESEKSNRLFMNIMTAAFNGPSNCKQLSTPHTFHTTHAIPCFRGAKQRSSNITAFSVLSIQSKLNINTYTFKSNTRTTINRQIFVKASIFENVKQHVYM